MDHYNNLLSPVVLGQGGDFDGPLEPSKKEAVILRIEIASPTEVKMMEWVSWIVAVVFVLLSTIALVVIRYKADPSEVLRFGNKYFIATIVIATFFLAVLLIVAVLFCRRIIHARRTGLMWSQRRTKLARGVFVILILQIVNLVFMLAAAGYAQAGKCNWQTRPLYSLGYAQWTLWNATLVFLIALAHNNSLWTGKVEKAIETEGDNPPDTAEAGEGVQKQDYRPQKRPPVALVMDAPWTIHLKKAAVWAALQVMITIMVARFKWLGIGTDCQSDGPLVCGPPSDLARVGFYFQLVIIWIYFLTYLYFAWCTSVDIKSRPYAEMRMVRMVFGVQNTQVLPVFAAFALCSTLLMAINSSSCWTFVQIWMGVIPLQAAGSSMAATLCFYFMPKKPGNVEEVLQAWLQEFAWTADSLPQELNSRNAKLASSAKLAQEPMFCVESAIKLLYFSTLAYDIRGRDALATAPTSVDPLALSEPIEKTPADNVATEDAEGDATTEEQQDSGLVLAALEGALRLYKGLNRAEVIYDTESDTKGVLAWGGHTLVITFKGTSSLENAMTNLALLKTRHPPLRTAPLTSFWGARLLQIPVLVHKGFIQAWTGQNYAQRVLHRVDQIISELGGPGAATVHLTGHSLGGALATLAAHAIKTAYPSIPLQVYTFGQPRVGNVAFSYEYNRLVRPHFSVVCGDDPVPGVPKGGYTRVGRAVFIDTSGEMVVRPTYLETQLIRSGAPKLKDHSVGSYRLSFMRLIKAQFRTENGAPGGARELARELNLNDALLGVNCSESELDNPSLQPITQKMANKLAEAVHSTKSRKNGPLWGSCSCGGSCGYSHRGDGDEEEVQQKEESGRKIGVPAQVAAAESLPV